MADFAVNFVATGGAQVEQQLQAILRGSTATSAEITRLSRSLKTSGEGAAAFATNLGLSVKETANAVTKFRQLEKAGFDNASAFQLMQKETGITAEQFGKLTEGLSSAQVQLDKYKESQQGSAKASAAQVLALQQVNQAAANLASSLGSIVSQATEEFIAYDDALTSVAAKSGVAKDALGFLEEATQRVALTTSQSPTSALKAADSLIALGASAQEAADRVGSVAQLTDALRTVGADIETSAKVVQLGTSIFAKFGETAETVGDKLVTISDSSAVASSEGLNEFLQVLSKAGGFAAQLGVGLDELLASFATLRDAGQAPEVAATSLRGLLSTALESRNELENLGITVFEVGQNGQESFVGLERLFAQIGQKSVDTTDLLDLFGKQGVASAVALSENYGKVSTQVDNLSNSFGNLQRKSNTINSSIQGQITLLQGSLQTALVEIGRTTGQFTAPLVGLVTDLVNAFISASPVIKNFVGGLVGISAVLATAVAGATSYALALKALETAQVGLTLKTAASTIGIQAKTASLKLAALAGNAEAKAALASASASGVQAGALQGVSAAAGTTAASLGLIIVALGSIALAAKAYQVITAESGQTREATNELSDAIDQYEAGLGKVITTQDGWLESFQGVVNRIRDAVAEFPLLAGAVDRYTQSLRQAQVNQNSIAFGELQQQLNRTSQAFADLKTSNDLSGDAAADLLPILKQQLATLQAFQPATESEITVRGAAIKQTREQINAIQGAIDAQQKQSEQSKNDIKIAEERATELKAKEEEIALESTRIEQEKNQEIERLAKEKIAELERIEKERIETEKALRQAAYDEEV
ncbi:MAG: phage tail tape measure protein, partial [Candidatus Nanopelagicaceae bacterium]